MAAPKEITIPSQPIQHGIGMPYSSPPEKEKMQQQAELEKRQKKAAQYGQKRKSMENEKDKQKAEYEKSGNELKSLLAQFGSKAKANEELDRNASELRGSIKDLLIKVQSKGKSPQVIETPPTPESRISTLISIALFPFTLIRHIISTLYSSINWTVLLTVILLIELTIVGLIWASRRAYNSYLYVEPYEAVIHGTYGTDQSLSWNILRSAVISMQDFFAEVMKGGRGFGSPGYDGFVPI
ncbi:14953_t:CDS:2 [Acaulospora colombiana]|uniref:14953_t:CDS:1 n=1 Tax=Acaulospora colombiana TaxID=27376 RepID=A0ACA9KTW3_9GLOM|nr:14953_t:CDS:2 [Acaulospora colombiana]